MEDDDVPAVVRVVGGGEDAPVGGGPHGRIVLVGLDDLPGVALRAKGGDDAAARDGEEQLAHEHARHRELSFHGLPLLFAPAAFGFQPLAFGLDLGGQVVHLALELLGGLVEFDDAHLFLGLLALELGQHRLVAGPFGLECGDAGLELAFLARQLGDELGQALLGRLELVDERGQGLHQLHVARPQVLHPAGAHEQVGERLGAQERQVASGALAVELFHQPGHAPFQPVEPGLVLGDLLLRLGDLLAQRVDGKLDLALFVFEPGDVAAERVEFAQQPLHLRPQLLEPGLGLLRRPQAFLAELLGFLEGGVEVGERGLRGGEPREQEGEQEGEPLHASVSLR